MKRVCLGILAVIGFTATGCRGLTPSVSHDGLTKENMEFINSVQPDETPRVIKIDGGRIELPMQHRASVEYPPVLKFYLQGFAKVEPKDEYYYARATSLFCIFLDAKATVYNKEGRPRHRESRLWLSCFLFQHRSTTLDLDTDKPHRHWSVRMINVPLTEITMFGWGTDYLQLFFVPIVTPG